jgi:predicted nucleic acid-binding protein
MTRVVVSDTSPIRALAHFGELVWLERLFGQIYLPPAVAQELASPSNPLTVVIARNVPFLSIVAPTDAARIAALQLTLDSGEAEAIALAEQLKADLILVDETVGRRAALDAGFQILGTLGIILEAKRQGWCSAVEPMLDKLETELRFFIAPKLRQLVLTRAGEVPPRSSP